MQPTTLQHPASADSYIRHGWALVPIPGGTKGPRTVGWNQREAALTSAADLPQGYGIGLAHAYSGTMALDIDDWARASFELAMRGVDLHALYDAPDAVVIDSGRQGRGKLLYAMPAGLVLPSHKLIDKHADGTAYNYLDYRCGTTNGLTVQDVLPPSIHPDTGQPYRWAGKGHWARLPLIPDALIEHWRSSLTVVQKKAIATGTSGIVSWEEITSALSYLDPSCDRKTWISVGMALHYAEHQSSAAGRGQALWDEWSRGSPAKYPGERGIATQWRAFTPDKDNLVRLGTLFHTAKAAGWERPTPDVSSFFGPTEKPSVDMSMMLRGIRPDPPDLDLNLVPAILRERALTIGKEMGADPLVPLFAGMAAAAGAMDARARLQLLPRFEVPPVLWIMTIGKPAQRKTPASGPMIKPLNKLLDAKMPAYAEAMMVWEGLEARWARDKKSFIDACGSDEARLSGEVPLPPVSELPKKPVFPRITVDDITSQRLVPMIADRPEGLLCYMDEMGNWCKVMTDRTSSDNRSTWVKAYEANRYENDRVGSGTVIAENLAMSVYGNIQPRLFWRTQEALSEDGLLQRFIPVILRNRDWGVGDPKDEVSAGAENWENTLRLINDLPAQTYRLTPEARALYREFQHWYNAEKQDEELLQSSDTFMTAFGKLEGLVGRVALVWHILESPFSLEVSEGLMSRVIQFVKTFVIPAYRYAFGESSGERGAFEAWLVDWLILHSDETQITMSEVRAGYGQRWAGMNKWNQDQWILTSMAVFEQSLWVKRADDGSMEHRHQAHWVINPLLQSSFVEHRTKLNDVSTRRAVNAMGMRFWPLEEGKMKGKFTKNLTAEEIRRLWEEGKAA